MTQGEFDALREGDVIRSASGQVYIVTDNYGSWKVAVQAVTLTNPPEWDLVPSRQDKDIEWLEQKVADQDDYIVTLEEDLENARMT